MTKLAVKERPILFSAPMVRAVIEGRKTQTRRVIKPQPDVVFGVSDDRIECYHSDYGQTISSETHSIFTERRLQSWERRPDLLAVAIQGLWQKGVRGLVSAQGALARQREVHQRVLMSRECKSDQVGSSTDLYGISRETPRCNAASPPLGREPLQQSTGKPSMGNSTGELAGQEATRSGSNRGESSSLEVDERGAFTYPLGSTEQPMQPPSRRAYSGTELLYDLRNCPYLVGHRLWVRETWAGGSSMGPESVDYRADGFDYGEPVPWRPSIHMPRWASRITLEITEVRVQRVQEISEEDALAEGVHVGARAAEDGKENHCRICGEHRRRHVGVAMACFGGMGTVFDPATYRGGFRFLWDSINAKRGFRWDGNPWVWAISFKRIGVMPWPN